MENMRLRVAPEDVRTAADEIEQIAANFAAIRGPLLEAMRSTAIAVDGWRLGRGLAQLDEAWLSDLRAFEVNLCAAADALIRAAAAYRAGDEASSHDFRSLR